MTVFPYRQGELCVEDIPLASIAQLFGTPCHVDSRAAPIGAFGAYRRA
ncbi:MAG: hypothetical protein WC100_14565 [Sterolibacterium sp.]